MKFHWWWLGALAGVIFVALLPSSVVIVDGREDAAQQQANEFDPAVYVDGIWETELVPTIEANAQDLSVVLGAIEVDADGNADKAQLAEVTEEYGTITDGEAHVYMLRGAGTVTAVGENGLATLDLDGYDGPIEVQVYAKTRIPADDTSIRDAVGFIGFGDFDDQTQYGKAGSEINKRVVRDVLTPLADTELVGEQISFLGAFGMRTFNLVQIDLSSVRVVPVQIVLEG